MRYVNPRKTQDRRKKKENIIISRMLPTGRKNIIVKILPMARKKIKIKTISMGMIDKISFG
jgi:hypothetical protein